MSAFDPARISATLLTAERDATPVAPFTRRNPFLPAEVGYAAQDLTVAAKCAEGDRVIGCKLGMTSAVKRRALGIAEPVFGRLTSRMLLAPDMPLTLSGLIAPRAEPELALRIGAPVPADAGPREVLAATEAVHPAIEVVDSRYDSTYRLVDSVADNAGAARVALGPGRPPHELPEPALLGCLFSFPGGADTAAGGAAMGDPLVAVSWLVGALAARGQRLEAGWLVLTGGLTAAVPLRPGSTVTAEFDGLDAVRVHCR